jgi:lipid A ethanolaminephosphotransferase
MPTLTPTPSSDDLPHSAPAPRRRAWNPLAIGVVSSLWIATVCNWPLWQAFHRLPETVGTRSLLMSVVFAVIVAAGTFIPMSLLAWRWTIKPVVGFMFISAAIGAHFMGTYNVVLDPTMMANVIQTDARETRDLMNWQFVLSIVVLGLLPIAALWRVRVRQFRLPRQVVSNVGGVLAALLVMVACILATFGDISPLMRNHKTLRWMITPLNSYWSLGVLAAQANRRPDGPPTPIGMDAHLLPRPTGGKPPLVVLVVGETGRADHWSLNGYDRPTNAELPALGVQNYGNVMSCGTNTAASLPCMFSRLGREGFLDRKHDEEGLMDVLWKAGLAVLWIDNQSGCKGACERVPNTMADKLPAGVPPLPADMCTDGECLDMALLHGIDQRLAALDPARRAKGVVLVMHQMGSHGPAYYLRSPADGKPFMPECTTNVLQKCDHQALINGYDNSIHYTDHMLAATIGWLKQQTGAYDPALYYVSDHGESLGEHNLYLHGLPYSVAPIEQKHVPMITWWPAQTEASLGLKPGCLAGRSQQALTHDNLFHTIMGLAGVRSSDYRPQLDLLTACRASG